MSGLGGLVAYDGSDSSSSSSSSSSSNSGSEDEDEQMSGSSSSNHRSARDTDSNGEIAIVKSVIFSKFIDDEDDEAMHHDDAANITKAGKTAEEDSSGDEETSNQSKAKPIWSKFLPQPKKAPVEVVEDEDDVEIGPIPPKKTYGDEELPQPPKLSSIGDLSSTKVKGKVRISMPFLSALDDDGTSEEGEKKKILQPAQKGSGLFSLLPQPRNTFGSDDSNMFLKNTSSKSAPAPVVQKSESVKPQSSSSSMSRLIPDSVKNKLKRPAPNKLDEIRAKLSKKGPAATVSKFTKDSDSDDDDSGDFFSLDSTEKIDPEALEKLKLPMQNFDERPAARETANEEEMEVEDVQGYQHPVAGSSSRSDDLMKFIQPKKGRKEEVNIIDINADDLRPDNTEWLKNITDESQAPARKSKGLGGIVKRKHQITYLAFEAKAREQELKNQWAQNRANKMATNNKYGF